MRNPIVIDVEASGFGQHSYPIEVGLVTADGQRWSSLIKPYQQWQFWSDEAEAVHGISHRFLCNNGAPGDEVAATLNALIGQGTAYSDAWVVDKPWLTQLFFRAGITMQFTLSPIEAQLPDAQMACWDEAKRSVISELSLQRHRASTDALIIQQTYQRSAEMMKARLSP